MKRAIEKAAEAYRNSIDHYKVKVITKALIDCSLLAATEGNACLRFDGENVFAPGGIKRLQRHTSSEATEVIKNLQDEGFTVNIEGGGFFISGWANHEIKL